MIGCHQKTHYSTSLVDERFYSLASDNLLVICPVVKLFRHPHLLLIQVVLQVVVENLDRELKASF